jgi:D-inositol-3-phosphate glycosyltransferase
MRILMVTPAYFPVIGGTEIFIRGISLKLNERGLQTDIMTFDLSRLLTTSTTQRMGGLNVIKIPTLSCPKKLMYIGQPFIAWHIPLKFTNQLQGYDVVHFHNDADLSFPLFSYFVKKPKIFHCHCLAVNYNSYKKYPPARCILRKASCTYIAVSNYVATLLENLGVPRTRVKTILNGVDTEEFKPTAKKESSNLLLFVGRLDPIKGLHFLLSSLRLLHKPVHLVIVGPLSWNNDYNMKISRLIEEAGKKTIHKVTYVGEQKPENMVKWYQKAAMLILPSTAESLGLVALEAMACGTPVIASNVGGIPEIVGDHRTGLLVPPGNVAELAKKIEYLLDNEDLRRKFSHTARWLVVNEFSYDVIAEKLIRVYEQIAY